jgi:hypothetical protein
MSADLFIDDVLADCILEVPLEQANEVLIERRAEVLLDLLIHHDHSRHASLVLNEFLKLFGVQQRHLRELTDFLFIILVLITLISIGKTDLAYSGKGVCSSLVFYNPLLWLIRVILIWFLYYCSLLAYILLLSLIEYSCILDLMRPVLLLQLWLCFQAHLRKGGDEHGLIVLRVGPTSPCPLRLLVVIVLYLERLLNHLVI